MPLNPTDYYSGQKVECEQFLKKDEIVYCTLRLAAVPPTKLSGKMDTSFFDFAYTNRIEFVHTRDVGIAFANAAKLICSNSEVLNRKVLNIAGGTKKGCQLYYGDFINILMEGIGIGSFPKKAFGNKEFYTDWLDTKESQQLLNYQELDVDDFVDDVRSELGIKRIFIGLFKGVLHKKILNHIAANRL